MAARVIDAKGSRIVGTIEQIKQLLRSIGTSVIDLKGSQFIILEKPLSEAQLLKMVEARSHK